MKVFRYILIISLFSILSSCVNFNREELKYITLSANVNGLEVASKSAMADPFEQISSTDCLDAKVLFSFNSTLYENNPDTENGYFIPCHTNVVFEDESFTFVEYLPEGASVAQPLKYPTSGNTTVYCAGFYPNDDNWDIQINNGQTKVCYPIDGSTDIMFADVISGEWNSPFPAQNYRHLQSWVKVLVSAHTIEAAANWGKIKKIVIQSEENVEIDLGTTCNVSYSHSPNGTYKDIVVYEATGEEEGTSLSITSNLIGSVFLVPPTNCQLHVKVYTETFPDEGKPEDGKDAIIRLYDLENNHITDRNKTIGKLFVLNLNFTNLSVIEGVCTLNYWNDQDNDLYLQ